MTREACSHRLLRAQPAPSLAHTHRPRATPLAAGQRTIDGRRHATTLSSASYGLPVSSRHRDTTQSAYLDRAGSDDPSDAMRERQRPCLRCARVVPGRLAKPGLHRGMCLASGYHTLLRKRDPCWDAVRSACRCVCVCVVESPRRPSVLRNAGRGQRARKMIRAG